MQNNADHPFDDDEPGDGAGQEREPVPFDGLGDTLHNGQPIRSFEGGFHYFSACFAADTTAAYARARRDWPASLGNIDAYELVIAAITALARQAAGRWVSGGTPTLRSGPGLLYWGIDMAKRSEIRRRRRERDRTTVFDPGLGHGGTTSDAATEVTRGSEEAGLQFLCWLVAAPVALGISMLTDDRKAALRQQVRGEAPDHADSRAAAAWRSQLRHARRIVAEPIRAGVELLAAPVDSYDNDQLVDDLLLTLLEDGWIRWDVFAGGSRRFSQQAMDDAIADMRRRAVDGSQGR